MRAFGVLIVALVLLALRPVAAAETVIGLVTGARGDVFRESAGGREAIGVGAPVRIGDTLTCNAGKVRVQLNDGTVLSIGENSRLDFSDYRSTGNAFTTRVTAGPGVFRLLVNRLTEGGFTVETETAVASVRGTEWVMEATADATAVAMLDGVLSVSGRGAGVGTVQLQGAGQGTDIRRGAAPTTPATWGAQRFATLVGRASFD